MRVAGKPYALVRALEAEAAHDLWWALIHLGFEVYYEAGCIYARGP